MGSVLTISGHDHLYTSNDGHAEEPIGYLFLVGLKNIFTPWDIAKVRSRDRNYLSYLSIYRGHGDGVFQKRKFKKLK